MNFWIALGFLVCCVAFCVIQHMRLRVMARHLQAIRDHNAHQRGSEVSTALIKMRERMRPDPERYSGLHDPSKPYDPNLNPH